MPPTYYRGCWHVVSRGFLVRYRQGTSSYSRTCSSLTTEFYDPKTFITHAALLRQTFVHCGRFPTAASRRSLGRVSVPVWLATLSRQLRVTALVGRYPTNKLIRRGPIPDRRSICLTEHALYQGYPVLAAVSLCYPSVQGTLSTCYSPVRRSSTSRRKPFRSTCMC